MWWIPLSLDAATFAADGCCRTCSGEITLFDELDLERWCSCKGDRCVDPALPLSDPKKLSLRPGPFWREKLFMVVLVLLAVSRKEW